MAARTRGSATQRGGLVLWLVLVAATGLAGCGPSGAAGRRDERSPAVRPERDLATDMDALTAHLNDWLARRKDSASYRWGLYSDQPWYRAMTDCLDRLDRAIEASGPRWDPGIARSRRQLANLKDRFDALARCLAEPLDEGQARLARELAGEHGALREMLGGTASIESAILGAMWTTSSPADHRESLAVQDPDPVPAVRRASSGRPGTAPDPFDDLASRP